MSRKIFVNLPMSAACSVLIGVAAFAVTVVAIAAQPEAAALVFV